jgi:HSP20 family protein
MNELMDQFFGSDSGTELGLWFAPRVNVAETDTAFEVSVDLPGMKPEDFSVELKEGHLWITGERRQETEEKGKTYHRVERQYGRFQRVIPLPAAVNPDKIEAEYKDGVLRITLPKDESAQPKRIPVKT